MIIESVEVLAPAGKNEDIERGFSSLLGPVRAEACCLASRLLRDAINPHSFRFEAQWRTKDNLTQHVRSDEYRKLLFLVELSAEPPTVEFHEVAQTLGLEFVQSVRKSEESDSRVGDRDIDDEPLIRQP